TGLIELGVIDLSEELALIEFQAAVKVAREGIPGNIEHTNLRVDVVFQIGDQVAQAAPTRFQLLQPRMMQHRVYLSIDERIDRTDVGAQLSEKLLARRDRPVGMSRQPPECQCPRDVPF